MNTEHMTQDTETPISETANQAFDNLLSVGRLWAVHGLGIGRSALRASARTLEMTAETLSEIESRFEERDPE
jgi:hypothetical protein